VVALACGTGGLEKRRKAYESFYRGELDTATARLAEAENSKDRLLFALDRGVIAHTEGRLEESNTAFAEAEAILEELLTKDASDIAASFIVNDYQLEYKGEDFEKVLVHPFKALNYLSLGEPGEALVECRALNDRLVEIQQKYETKSVYSEDAFARYLSGVIYESEGDKNGALVDYRLAARAFEKYERDYGTPFPESLRRSLLRLSEAQGLDHLVREFQERWPEAEWMPYRDRKEQGEFVLVLENGPAPVKEGERFDVVVDDEIYSIAFPVYRALPAEAAYGVLRVGEREERTELMEDVSAIAGKDLKDRYHRVVAKGLTRAVVKHLEVKKVKEQNVWLGRILNVVNSLNEQADLRSWETLPANFQMVRLVVPPGFYEKVELVLFRPGGAKIDTIDLGPWEVERGRTRFLYYRTLS